MFGQKTNSDQAAFLFEKILNSARQDTKGQAKAAPIKITQLHVGYVVKIDNKKIAVENKEALKIKLCAFIDNPERGEEIWEGPKRTTGAQQ